MLRLGRSAAGFFLAGGLFLALGGVPPANAQEAASQGPGTQEAAEPAADETPSPASSFRPAGRGGTGWTLIVSPYVWGASLGGDLGLAGLQSEARPPFGNIFKHLDLAAMGHLEVVNGM